MRAPGSSELVIHQLTHQCIHSYELDQNYHVQFQKVLSIECRWKDIILLCTLGVICYTFLQNVP